MPQTLVDNKDEQNYQSKIVQIADKLHAWQGPIVLISHIDPDGDALGSSLALKRALDSMGKTTHLPLDPPRYLSFITEDGELSASLETLPKDCLLVVLDVADEKRAVGAPLQGASYTINIDHHGTNDRFGDLACVSPSKAATAQIVKDIIDAMNISWTPAMATACLTGILTDTGNFRFSNTSPDVLSTAGQLLDKGVNYANLTDRLQWRHPDYFTMLGKVMSTVEFAFDGLVVMAKRSQKMLEEIGETDDDSDDYVGLIRYAEGSKIAIFLKEREDHTKLSVRTRDGVSAQAICMALGGGGHVNAAGAKIVGTIDEARKQVLAASEQELSSKGLLS